MLSLAQNALMAMPAERAHDFTIAYLRKTQRSFLASTYTQTLPVKPAKVWGLDFVNPVGLAAGLDKNGECVDAFHHMGFGFVEVGTVTPIGQPGNPKPRLFRIPQKHAIINRMGFNNHGVDYLLDRVNEANRQGIVGINIGKNKATPEEDALSDYLICLDKVYLHADYITVNISSPNTPGLRNLQYGAALDNLLTGLKASQLALADKHGRYVPIAVKIAPDLTDEELKNVAQSLVDAKMDGVIATNTTLTRDSVAGLANADEAGGLSGSILTDKSLAITQALVAQLQGAMPIISVGGIDSPEAAKARFAAGADLVQLYSAFIYQGPALVRDIVKAL